MDWGTVASVLVALALLLGGMMVICVPIFVLAARGIKKKMEAGGVPRCPIPGCPFHSDIEKAVKAAARNPDEVVP